MSLGLLLLAIQLLHLVLVLLVVLDELLFLVLINEGVLVDNVGRILLWLVCGGIQLLSVFLASSTSLHCRSIARKGLWLPHHSERVLSGFLSNAKIGSASARLFLRIFVGLEYGPKKEGAEEGYKEGGGQAGRRVQLSEV